MLTPALSRRQLLTALALGAAALLSNGMCAAFGPSALVPLGHVFLFISAGALGGGGALVSCAIALSPYFFATGQQIEALRLVVLCLSIAYAAEFAPRIPLFMVAAATWLLVLAPLVQYSGPAATGNWVMMERGITFYALQEVLLALIAGTLLLNATVWAWLTQRPRHLQLSTLLIHVVTIASTLAVISALYALLPSTQTASGNWQPAFDQRAVFLLAVGAITIPALAAWRLSALIQRDFRRIFAAQLSADNRGQTFSGLSSDYWRRRTSEPAGAKAEGGENKSDLGAVGVQGICALTRNGTISFVNRKFSSLLGITVNDLIGKNISAIGLNPEILRSILKLVEDSFAYGARSVEVKTNQYPDKLRFFEIATRRPESYEQSSISEGPDGIILLVSDITDRRTVESHLLQAQKLHSLGEVIGGIAHAFNNSLTAIIGHSSYARTSADPAELQSSLDEIRRAAGRAGELVRKLLEFAEGSPTTMKVVDLDKELRGRLDLLEKMVGDDYEIVYRNPNERIAVQLDGNLMMQCLTSLVLNAKESYGSRPGQIEVTVDTEHIDEQVACLHGSSAYSGDFARMRIKDHGAGMSREVLAHAFDPLFTTKALYGHSGLGLSIVFAIVRAHDGFLAVESHPEKGTTVSIYLPLRPIAELQPDHGQNGVMESMHMNDLRNGSSRILVVEDEPTVRDLITKMLSSLGYTVSSCSNGQEALAKQAKDNFDLVLVDMIMPKMNGIELISKLHEINSSTKTLIMTGYGLTSGATESGTDVIPKPFDLETLAAAVKRALHGSRLSSSEPAAGLPSSPQA